MLGYCSGFRVKGLFPSVIVKHIFIDNANIMYIARLLRTQPKVASVIPLSKLCKVVRIAYLI